MPHLGPQGQISYFNQDSANAGAPPFAPPTSAQLAGKASVLPRVSPPTPSRCNPVAFRLKPRESVPHLGPQGQISYLNQDSANAEAPPFAPPTSAQLAGSASVLPRVSPPTPSRCYPVAIGLKPRESVPHLGPQGQIFNFNQDSANAEAPPFAPPTSAQLAGSASVLPRVSPPTPSRCNPVAFGLKPRESVPHLGPQCQISYFIQDSADAEAPPFAPPTSAQLAGSASVLPRVSPPTPSRCNPVALGLKPRESVPHLGPQCQISYFNQDSANAEAPPFAPPTSAQLAGSASVLPRVSPPTPSRCNPVAFGLKPRESVTHLGPQCQISYFNQDSANAEAPPFMPPTSAQLAGSASVLPRVSPPTPSRCYPVTFGLKPRESVPHLGPQGQIFNFNKDSANAEAPPFAPPTSAQLAGSASVLPRVSPPIPSRCNPVAFGLMPRESVPHLGPQCQILYFNQDSANAEAPLFTHPTSAQLAGSASVLPRVSPPTPSRCNPVAFGLKPRESVPHLGPQCQISYFIQDSANAEAPPFAPPTSAQLAGSASVLPRVSPPTPSRCNPVALGLKPRESVPHLGPQGQISYFNQDSANAEAPPFAPPTSAQLAGSASVLPRVSPPTPFRCNPVALGLKPRESVPHLGPQGQISYFNQDSANAEAPPFAPPTSAQLAGSASVLPRVSPPTPSRCNPVAFGLKPRESVPHLGPQGQISYFNQDSANAEAPLFAPPTSAQLAGSASVLPRVSPPTPSRCNPVAFGLKPRESVSHLGTQCQISYFNQDSANAEAPPFAPPTSAQLAGSASALPRVSPSTPSRCNPIAFRFKPR